MPRFFYVWFWGVLIVPALVHAQTNAGRQNESLSRSPTPTSQSQPIRNEYRRPPTESVDGQLAQAFKSTESEHNTVGTIANDRAAKSVRATDPTLDLPLPPPSRSIGKPTSTAKNRSRSNSALMTVVLSLLIVLSAFFGVVWLTQRGAAKTAATLPAEVVDVLGRIALAPRQQLQLIRVGRKIVLICITQSSTTTLTEITDDEEVARISGICASQHPGRVTQTFRDVLGQFQRNSNDNAFFGNPKDSEHQVAKAPQSMPGEI